MPAKSSNSKVRQVDFLSPVKKVDDAGSRTLRRGLQLLDVIAGSGSGGVRMVDLCLTTGLERPTVYRLLAALMEGGHVARQGRFHYVAGPRLTSLARSTGLPVFAERLRPVLASVSATCGDAAFAIAREGAQSHCIARHLGTHPVQVLVIQVGTRQPLGVGAAGLALLAALPDEDVRMTIEANASVLGQYGGMTAERMNVLVRSTRERGWSVVGNHAIEGILAVGMAVCNAKGVPVAAISIASTQGRMPRERQQLIARAMHAEVSKLAL